MVLMDQKLKNFDSVSKILKYHFANICKYPLVLLYIFKVKFFCNTLWNKTKKMLRALKRLPLKYGVLIKKINSAREGT